MGIRAASCATYDGLTKGGTTNAMHLMSASTTSYRMSTNAVNYNDMNSSATFSSVNDVDSVIAPEDNDSTNTDKQDPDNS